MAIENTNNIEERRSKIVRKRVFDCHLLPHWRQMAIKTLFLSVFDPHCRLLIAYLIAAYPVCPCLPHLPILPFNPKPITSPSPALPYTILPSNPSPTYHPQILKKEISSSNTMACLPVCGDYPQALASGLSYVQVDKHGITILYHLHQYRTCTSQDILC